MSAVQSFVRLAEKKGIPSALWRSFGHVCEEVGVATYYREYVWPSLPVRDGFHYRNGIKVAGVRRRWFDGIVPFRTPGRSKTRFKEPNLYQIRKHVRRGDVVGIIGAGFGVSCMVSARETGDAGKVIAYDGDIERVQTARKSLAINDPPECVSIEHAVVGSGFGDFDFAGVRRIKPAELPSFDVLEMDCEGAEHEILPQLSIRPRVLIVELHHEKGWTTYDSPEPIIEILGAMGYNVELVNGPWVDGLVVASKM